MSYSIEHKTNHESESDPASILRIESSELEKNEKEDLEHSVHIHEEENRPEVDFHMEINVLWSDLQPVAQPPQNRNEETETVLEETPLELFVIEETKTNKTEEPKKKKKKRKKADLEEHEQKKEKEEKKEPQPPKLPPPLALAAVQPSPPPAVQSNAFFPSAPMPATFQTRYLDEKKEEIRQKVRSRKNMHNLFFFFFFFHLTVNFGFLTFAIIVLCDETSNEFPDPCRNIRERVFIPFGVILFLTYLGGRIQAIRKLAKAHRQKVQYSLPQLLWRPHVLVATFIPEVIPIACSGYLFYVTNASCHEYYKDHFPGMRYWTFFHFYITGASWVCFLCFSFLNMKGLNPMHRFWTIQKSFVVDPNHLLVRLEQLSQTLQPLDVED